MRLSLIGVGLFETLSLSGGVPMPPTKDGRRATSSAIARRGRGGRATRGGFLGPSAAS